MSGYYYYYLFHNLAAIKDIVLYCIVSAVGKWSTATAAWSFAFFFSKRWIIYLWAFASELLSWWETWWMLEVCFGKPLSTEIFLRPLGRIAQMSRCYENCIQNFDPKVHICDSWKHFPGCWALLAWNLCLLGAPLLWLTDIICLVLRQCDSCSAKYEFQMWSFVALRLKCLAVVVGHNYCAVLSDNISTGRYLSFFTTLCQLLQDIITLNNSGWHIVFLDNTFQHRC